ncbi:MULTISPECIES: hypothetical protein [unclassified Eubacterium (in: firmicutes)]|jgi:predicted translin family RNA/ssDNA-binding protein|uniref:hypothetical protein n=1 Tax=Eubacterium TaxID=1730 RepID=UPI000E4EFA66|nr:MULTISPECIES: hypothetical protein [unclassified Eubacterium (in: firmicutes)]RGF49913.1 hypothetical protein DW006_08360 [Eubacterium sp. AF36-5BH]RHP21139.1 hypothetical protein DWZ69_06830 [Eubacterium sp. AF34-35BH]
MRILNHDMQRFLTYTNFEIDIDNEKEDILKKCINRAYRDLSRRIPYKYSLSMIKNMKKEDAKIFNNKKEEFKNSVYELFKENINSITEPIELIELIKQKADEQDIWTNEKGFTYGLSQKWVNMTLKYLLMFDECPISKEKLDVPVDSYIIKVANASEEKNKLGLDLNYCKSVKWSTWNDITEYTIFQDKIRKKTEEKNYETKIDWEYHAWLEQAKENK